MSLTSQRPQLWRRAFFVDDAAVFKTQSTLAAFGHRIAATFLTPLVMLMFVVSVWLVYLQAFVIHAFCQYCLFSAGVTTALTVIVLFAVIFRAKR